MHNYTKNKLFIIFIFFFAQNIIRIYKFNFFRLLLNF